MFGRQNVAEWFSGYYPFNGSFRLFTQNFLGKWARTMMKNVWVLVVGVFWKVLVHVEANGEKNNFWNSLMLNVSTENLTL
jgi:hypothetical protein